MWWTAPSSAIAEPAGSRTLVMGVLNLTPDSFSGDGIYRQPDVTAERAAQMAAEGAHVIDLGAESTRPGASEVPVQEELERLLPALRAVVRRTSLPLSVDTRKAEVARRALEEGAAIVNEVSGLRDPRMLEVVAAAGAALVLVHNGPVSPDDPMPALLGELSAGLGRAAAAGVTRVMVDPGFGFGKRWPENFAIMRRLGELRALGAPILVGPSRKRMIERVLGPGTEAGLDGTLALVSLCIAQGADMVRVHDVGPMVRAARMMDALARPGSGRSQ